MGVIAYPVSRHGLSTLGQSDDAPEEQATPALDRLTDMLRKLQQLLSVPVTGVLDTETRAALEEMGADLSSLTWWDFARSWLTVRKWYVIGGAALALGGGALIWKFHGKGKRRR